MLPPASHERNIISFEEEGVREHKSEEIVSYAEMRYFQFYCIRVLLLPLWKSITNSILALSVMPIQQSSVHKKLVGAVTASEIVQYAEMQGSSLSVSTMGPLFRVVARASHNESIILGYCDGAIRPSGAILHLDSMKVFKPSLVKAAATDDGFKRGGGTVFGIGLLLGCLCLRHGKKSFHNGGRG